ncbi:MAG: peptidase M64 [Bacteroidales bacterium]|nr:peptidase M64 [Bacteroidales bacterium]
MKKFITLCAAALLSIAAFAQQPKYETYFTPDRLRIDLTFAGDASYQKIYLDGLVKECAWSGSKTNLIDTFNYGEYRLEVQTLQGEAIYSKGFNTLFQEWRTTADAVTTPQAFCSSYTIPYPKEEVVLKVYERVKATGVYSEIFSVGINPADKLISHEVANSWKVSSLMQNGDPATKVDLCFIAEGYTAQEMEKFRADALRFTEYLFTMAPYNRHKEDFNIWLVESVSEESGTDIPHEDVWKKTVANSNFYTFRSDRYLTAQNQKTICQIATAAPYDALYVIVNNEKYGGGGIYNFYGLSASNCKWAEEVFVHEFGHSFAGLGDEYYDSSTSYEEFYNIKIEPWEPNLTTLVNFESKWKDMLPSGTSVPTPPLSDPKDNVSMGVFEGGGYMAKGIYRPVMDCRMKTNQAQGFCPVCQRAIEKMIGYYCK